MARRTLPNLTLMALIVSCFIQIGAQLFAIATIVSTVISAPPRSFAIFEGEYGYDSRAFWDTVPPITALLFLVALTANWRTQRRKLLLLAFSLFLVAGAVAGLYLEPAFAEIMTIGYRDVVDPQLQRRAARWYAFDWGVWLLGLGAGLALLPALARPVTDRSVPLHRS